LEQQCLWQSMGGLGFDSGEACVAPDEEQSVCFWHRLCLARLTMPCRQLRRTSQGGP
jgi:hypothetical protein